jgi:hypothetical protein
VVRSLLTSLETPPIANAAGESAGYYGVRCGLNTGVFCTLDEVRPLTFGVKGSLYRRFPTREEAEVFATAEKLYAVDKVERNEVLEPNPVNIRALPVVMYEFFATRQEAEAFLQPKEASDAEASPANVASEHAGKVAVLRCWRRL